MTSKEMAQQYSRYKRSSSLSEDEESDYVRVYWLPREVSQSHQQESKACTLIVVLVVHICHKARIEFSHHNPSTEFLDIFANCITRGNKIYERLQEAGRLKMKYLNIPEALEAVRAQAHTSVVEWESFFYKTEMKKTLHYNIEKGLEQWRVKRPKNVKSDLNIAILANLRAVVLIFNKAKGTVTLVDSHGHYPYGAVIAQASSKTLDDLCKWYAVQLAKDTGPIMCYELSFLYCK